ncbi:MAG TPA: aminotransferase class I/II-fold pyridoxal phosphate-dependent enzyme [Flavitalea sp.]|nr:aminotransferase class I/II-fold pyridoxal phosphate-dependent enzyme [Flavitalea sp.]
MSSINRRSFLKATSVTALPAIVPILPAFGTITTGKQAAPANPAIKFFGDADMLEPGDYITELQKAHSASAITKDRYGSGGAVEALEKKFVQITGKERAIFMPTGTMANEFAIAVLSGENTKVFLQDMSHVYRDEGDAAQSVFQKRLMPLAKGETFFTVQQLQNAIESLSSEEVFKSGIGAVSIENPVRRSNGRIVPLEEIQKISSYCKSNHIKLHLDGARIYIASAWSGISVKEYASYFDTVYISLYKYLGASAGAILCGDRSVIDKMPHLMKVHGGSMFGNWTNAALALYRLENIENRFKEVVRRTNELVTGLNKLSGCKLEALTGGTNIYNLQLASEIDGKKLQERLNKEYNIRIPSLNEKNTSYLTMNETMLYQSADHVINAFSKGIK